MSHLRLVCGNVAILSLNPPFSKEREKKKTWPRRNRHTFHRPPTVCHANIPLLVLPAGYSEILIWWWSVQPQDFDGWDNEVEEVWRNDAMLVCLRVQEIMQQLLITLQIGLPRADPFCLDLIKMLSELFFKLIMSNPLGLSMRHVIRWLFFFLVCALHSN